MLADQLLNRPVHLVGYSYGALVAMYAAARRPENVRSLTVVEPPATALVTGSPVVDEWAARIRSLMSSDSPVESVLRNFLELVGAPVRVTDPVHPTLLQGTRQLIGARPPDEALPPLDVLRDLPLLAVSGGHMQQYELICDAIATRTGAERATCPGAGHLVPDTGDRFNTVLENFLAQDD